jgi:hypothetical protein
LRMGPATKTNSNSSYGSSITSTHTATCDNRLQSVLYSQCYACQLVLCTVDEVCRTPVFPLSTAGCEAHRCKVHGSTRVRCCSCCHTAPLIAVHIPVQQPTAKPAQPTPSTTTYESRCFSHLLLHTLQRFRAVCMLSCNLLSHIYSAALLPFLQA